MLLIGQAVVLGRLHYVLNGPLQQKQEPRHSLFSAKGVSRSVFIPSSSLYLYHKPERVAGW